MLYKMVDETARELKAKTITGIALDSSFNASVIDTGFGRTFLCLGLPLVHILDGREKVALIAHELAHQVCHDPQRAFFIGTAVRTLDAWHKTLLPDEIWPSRVSAINAITLAISNLSLLALAAMPWILSLMLARLLWYEMQRAEYHADQLAADVAGTEAALGMLEKRSLLGIYEAIKQRVALAPDGPDFFAAFQQAVTRMPSREKERLARVTQMEDPQLDSSHPPTAFRLRLLRAFGGKSPKIVPEPAEMKLLDAELGQAHQRVHDELVEACKTSLYS